jgi:hypothetical protein
MYNEWTIFFHRRGHRGRDRMVVGFTDNYLCNQCLSPITKTKFIGQCYLNTMIVFRLIDRLLLNIQRSVWPTGATTPYDCHRKSMEIWIWTTISIFCSTYSFLKSTKDFFNMLRVWHSPSTFLTMVHGQVFRIIT